MSHKLQCPPAPGANMDLVLAAAISKSDVHTSVFLDIEIIFPIISGIIIKT